MQNTGKNYTIPISSTGTVTKISTGSFSFLYVSFAPIPFQISLDGVSWIDAQEGMNLGKLTVIPNSFWVQAGENQNVNSFVTIYVTDYPIIAVANKIFTAPYGSYPVGNCGFLTTAAIQAFYGAAITKVAITARGTNYLVGDLLSPATGVGTAAILQVTAIQSGGGNVGEIKSVHIVNGGSYTTNPNANDAAVGGNGEGATFTYTMGNAFASDMEISGGFFECTDVAPFLIPNFNQMNARKSIRFTVAAGSASSLIIQDENNSQMMQLDPPAAGLNSSVEFESSGLFYVLSNNGGRVTFNTSEIYYQN
jgi:hypothetical protein